MPLLSLWDGALGCWSATEASTAAAATAGTVTVEIGVGSWDAGGDVLETCSAISFVEQPRLVRKRVVYVM